MPTSAEPRIAWQPRERNIEVKPVANNEIRGTVFERAAEWRYAELGFDPRRKKVICELKKITDAISDHDLVPEVTNAATLKQFWDEYQRSSLDAKSVREQMLRKAAVAVLGDYRKTFMRNVRRFHDDVWEKPLLYKVGDIPLHEVIIVSLDHVRKDKFVDVDGAVGRTMFTITRNVGLGKNPLYAESISNLKGELDNKETSIGNRKGGNKEVADLLKTQISESQVKTMNNGGMIRWTLGTTLDDNVTCVSNLFANDITDPLYRLLGLVLSEYGGSQVNERDTQKLLTFKATLMCTVKEIPQECHRDYSEAALKGRGTDKGGPYPWSADIPLLMGGLYLNIWHGFDEEKGKDYIGNKNITVHVPLGYVPLSCRVAGWGDTFMLSKQFIKVHV